MQHRTPLHLRWLWPLLLAGTLLPLSAQSVIINELVSANRNGNPDAYGETSDWIELYNSGTASVLLTGWSLSDDENEPAKWTFPDTTLAAGGYLLVRASGREKAAPNGELHTPFRLQAEGEAVWLTRADGTVADVSPAVALADDQALGRTVDDLRGWFYLDPPTPGSSNETARAYTGTLAPPTFNLPEAIRSKA